MTQSEACENPRQLRRLTKYKKGALAVTERLEAYERRLADLSPGTPVEPAGVHGRIAAFHHSHS
jgi:hypothetical protein